MTKKHEDIVDAEIIEEGESHVVNEEIVESMEHGMSKLYICGPMTGKEDWNHPLFHKVTQEFRAVNFQVCNPAEFFDGDTTRDRKDYMREAFKYILEADTIVLLPGWEESKGARLEAALATELELIIVEYVDSEEELPPVGGTITSLDNPEKSVSFEGTLTPVDEDQEVEVAGAFTPVDDNSTE
jgi:hypothetical protein